MKTEIQRHSLIKGNEYTATKICFCTRYVGRCQVMEEYGNYNRAMKPSRRNKKPRDNVLPSLIFNLALELDARSALSSPHVRSSTVMDTIIFCGLMTRVSD